MAVAVDATGTESHSASGQTTVTNATLTTTGSANAVVFWVLVAPDDAATTPALSAITWAGTTMTNLLSSSNAAAVTKAFFVGLRSPTTGNQTFSVTINTASTVILQGQSYTGVDTSSDANAFQHRTNNSGTLSPASVVIPSGSASNLEVGAHVSDDNTIFTNSAGTQIFVDGGTGVRGLGNRAAGTGGNVTLSGTLSATNSWASIGMDISAPGAADVLAAGSLRFMRRKSVGWTLLSDRRSRIFRPRPKFYLPRKTILRSA